MCQVEESPAASFVYRLTSMGHRDYSPRRKVNKCLASTRIIGFQGSVLYSVQRPSSITRNRKAGRSLSFEFAQGLDKSHCSRHDPRTCPYLHLMLVDRLAPQVAGLIEAGSRCVFCCDIINCVKIERACRSGMMAGYLHLWSCRRWEHVF